MLTFSDWINRMRHNRGFGVQSPTAFFFVTQVLKEKLPYYAYKDIDAIARESGTHSKKMCRRLFRIANYLRPKSIIATGTESIAPLCSLAAAASSATVTLIASQATATPAAERYLAARHCKREKNLQELLQKGDSPLQLLYIGRNCDITSTLATALQHTSNNTAIIADGIHRTDERLQQWEEAVKDPRTKVTYDLYSMGILFFDAEKQKQHYTLKM